MRVEIRPGLEAHRSTSEAHGDRPERFLQHTALTSIHDAASWEEIDEIYDSIEDEAMRLAGALERNSAELIRTGIAERLVSCTRRHWYGDLNEPIRKSARFLVDTGEFRPKDKPSYARDPDPEVIALSYRNPLPRGSHSIGRRALVGSQEVEYTPLEPEFGETDVQIAAGLLGDLLDGSFPHITPGNLTFLMVHGSLDTNMEQHVNEVRQEMLAKASVFS